MVLGSLFAIVIILHAVLEWFYTCYTGAYEHALRYHCGALHYHCGATLSLWCYTISVQGLVRKGSHACPIGGNPGVVLEGARRRPDATMQSLPYIDTWYHDSVTHACHKHVTDSSCIGYSDYNSNNSDNGDNSNSVPVTKCPCNTLMLTVGKNPLPELAFPKWEDPCAQP